MSKTHLRDLWASLGIGFNTSNETQADPELAIISLVQSNEFPLDKKMMSLALLWMKEYSRFVHVERLKTYSETLLPFELALLKSIANKCVVDGDLRWRTLTTALTRNQKGDFPRDSELLLRMRGTDPDFAKFGIHVSPIEPESAKKLMPRKIIFSKNIWLRNRLLFGSNFRADIASVKSLGLANTAYGAAKYLGCSANSAYRSWNDLEEAGWK